METTGSTRLLIAVLGVALAAHVGLIVSLDSLPFADAPSHLARAVIIGDLWLGDGKRFGELFTFAPRFVPYILGDVVLSVLTRLMPADVAGRIWMVLTFAALPFAVGVYLRAYGFTRPQVLLGQTMAIYLSMDWFFLNGLTAYRFGLAITLAGLAAAKRYVERPTLPRLLVVWVSVIAAYLCHLSAHVFFGLAAAAFALVWLLRAAVSLRHALTLAAPFALLTIWHVFFGGAELGGEVLWGTPTQKLLRLGSPFVRFGYLTDLILLGLFAFSLVRLLARARLREPQVIDSLVAALVCVAAYFALPVGKGSIYDLDNRALPLVALFITFAALPSFPGPPRIERPVVMVLAVLLSANFAYMAGELLPANAALRDYRRVAGMLPEAEPFLYVMTRPPRGRTQPFMEAHAWATIDSRAYSPHLYSRRRGDAMTHFDIRPGLYEPSQFWYLRNDMVPDWPRVVQDYRYLLITEPFDSSRLGVTGRWVVRSETASLLEISALAAVP